MPARRYVIRRIGGPDVFEIEGFDPPHPGPGEVTIDVRAFGINFADLFCRLGLYRAAPPVPLTPGFEVAGVIAAAGRAAQRFAAGDRVFAVTRFGGYTTRLNVPAAYVRPLPAEWTFEQGAAFPVVFLTAWHGLLTVGHLKAGETVVVHSAAGGVGTAACQLVRAHGGRAIGTVGSEAKRAPALEAGAEAVIVSRHARVWDEILSMTDGVDLILDAVGGPGLRRGYEALRPGGRLVSYGFAEMMPRGGRRNWPALAWRWLRTPRFSPLDMTGRNRTVSGFNLVHLWTQEPLIDESFRALSELVTRGRIHPVLGRVFSFEEVPAAHAWVQSRFSTGKVVVSVA
jgi:NADPH:quinone reductase-like Zn-dependent oxidoreductase